MEQAIVPPPGIDTEQFVVVGIGASAGGLRALMELFQATPANSGMAYVVVVHLSPEHESRMQDVLQQATTMPVTAVTERVRILPGHVYVISPRSELRMDDGHLEPAASPRRGVMTIDLFFRTLADAHGHRAFAVVLSGTGSDGTLGARSIKAQGGITIAQSPEEAEYDAMPRNAIASGAVDFVLPIREIPAKLALLWRNAQAIRVPSLPEQPTPEDAAAEAEDAVRDILSALRAGTGYDFSQYKRATLLRRIERRLQVNQLRSLTGYRDFLASHPLEARALLRDLLISVTSFFRDPAAWQALEQRVIPDLLDREGGQVRVWVVGCATGEEAYSLAMLLQERVQGMGNPPRVNIFATDIDEEALAFARTGLYPETIAEQVSPERLRRFFVREHGHYRVQKSLREMVMFAVHNVIQDPPFSRLDLVSCRNLLIYLNRSVQAKVLDLLHFSLRPDGYLFLGMSESIEDGHDGFAVLDKTHRIFSQQPRARMGLTVASLPIMQPARPGGDAAVVGGRRVISFGDLHQRLLEHYAPPSVVVDERYDIVHLSDHAGAFLQLGPGEPSLSLLKVAPEELRYELKSALDQAMQSLRTVERVGVVFHRGGPEAVAVDVKVHPVRDRATGRTFALIIFDESVREPGGRVPSLPGAPGRPDTSRLEERLHDMEGQLRAAVEQYEVHNEELKASNEELQATNEELRATTEELETGKEELQSINEELTTVNQELKNKVDETTRISDDLTNFITATEIASMFVDREMRLMRYTPFAREVFNVIPTDVGRPLLDITHRLEKVDLEAAIGEVFETLRVVELEARSSDGRWYIVRCLPYRTGEDRIRGAVLTFVDITQRKIAEAVGRRSEAWARLIVDSVREYAIVTLGADGAVQSWNRGATKTFGWDADQVVGRNFELLFTAEDRAAGVPADELRRAREQGGAEDERWHLRKDGTTFWASGTTSPLDDGTTFGYVKVLRDLTEQQMAERRREELFAQERVSRAAAEEANRLKDEFLAMLSHELRNPLALTLMQAEILLRAPESQASPRLRQAAQVIHEMVRAQSQLVEDMLDVSRARTGRLAIERQLLPLSFVVADSIGALRDEAGRKSIALDVRIGDAPLVAAADPVRVRQIAWNLLSNALKFTPSGGTVRVSLAREGDWARLVVEDTGQGIAPEVMPHIFEWFRRGDAQKADGKGGMGIGLALVRHLVELHGGSVEAHSDGVGKGARFTVRLPLQESAGNGARASNSADPAGTRRLAGLAILIVDDMAANAESLRDLLSLEGADVEIALTGAQAIERARARRYDVAICDIGMPDMSGHDVAKAIAATALNAGTPAIAYSGFSGPAEAQRAAEAGFRAFVTKPADLEQLVAAISDARAGAS